LLLFVCFFILFFLGFVLFSYIIIVVVLSLCIWYDPCCSSI